MKEIAGLFGLMTRDPVFRCTVWEVNEICITVEKIPNFTPMKKLIAIKYRHVQHFVSDETIIMNSIDSTNILLKFPQSPLEKIFSDTCGISLWDGNFFRNTLIVYYYYSFRGSVRISER